MTAMRTFSERRCRRHTAGFSTADVLAATALTLILTAVVYSFQRSQLKAYAARRVYVDSQMITRSAMDLMTRELRMAAFDPAGTALTTAPGPNCPGNKQGFLMAGATKLRFQQDLNADGVISATGEDVTYEMVESDILRTDGNQPPALLVDHLSGTGLNFRYFDGSNPPIELVPSGSPPALTSGQMDCIAKVRVKVEASFPNPDPRAASQLVKSLASSEIAVRNRSLSNF
jgi:type IV pilus assembly protein PilW